MFQRKNEKEREKKTTTNCWNCVSTVDSWIRFEEYSYLNAHKYISQNKNCAHSQFICDFWWTLIAALPLFSILIDCKRPGMLDFAILNGSQCVQNACEQWLLLLKRWHQQIGSHILNSFNGTNNTGRSRSKHLQYLNGKKEKEHIFCYKFDSIANWIKKNSTNWKTYSSILYQFAHFIHGNASFGDFIFAPLTG